MAVDRSKFKPAQVADLKNQEEEVQSVLPTNYDSSGRVDYHKLEAGDNKHKLLPPHPDKKSYKYPKSVCFLPKEVYVDAAGKEVWDLEGQDLKKLKKDIKNKPVFNCRVHGSKPKDLVECYKKIAEDLYKETGDTKYVIVSDWKTGLSYSNTWVAYSKDIVKGKIGLLDLKTAVNQGLSKLAIQDEDEQPITTDPFTDIDDGFVICIKYNPDAKQPKDYYSTSFITTSKGTVVKHPLKDEDLEAFEKLTPLEDMYVNSFTRRDLQLQIDGLKIYDDKNNLGIFATDEFLAIAEEIDAYFPEEDETKKDKKSENKPKEQVKQNTTPPAAKKVVTPIPEEDDDTPKSLDQMNREELKVYIAENELAVVVKKSMTDDMIRQAIKDVESVSKEEPEDFLSKETPEAEEEVEEKASTQVAAGASEKLAALRAKMKK